MHWAINEIMNPKRASTDICLIDSFIESMLLVSKMPLTVNAS